MADVDDGIRGEIGIVVSAVERTNGRLRLVLEDVEPAGAEWRPFCLFTRHDYDPRDFAEMNLSDQDFQHIGEMVVARIAALRRRTS